MLFRSVSMGALLFSRVNATPAHEAFRAPTGTGWESWTWARSNERITDLAAGFLALGLQPEERVAIASTTRLEWIFADLAVMCAGGATTTVYPSTNSEDVAYIISDSGSRFVVAEDAKQLAKLLEQRSNIAGVDCVILMDTAGVDPVVRTDSWVITLDDLAARGRTLLASDADAVTRANAAVGPDNLATLIYTSGTTGKPKGVVYTHRSIVLHALATATVDVLGLSNRDSLCPVVPMFHVNAWGLPFTGVMVGCKLVMPGPHLDAASLLDLYQSERVTFTAGVPTIWMGILQALEKNPGGWKLTPRMRMIVGGAAAPEAMIRAFDRFDLEVLHAAVVVAGAEVEEAAAVGARMLVGRVEGRAARREGQRLRADLGDADVDQHDVARAHYERAVSNGPRDRDAWRPRAASTQRHSRSGHGSAPARRRVREGERAPRAVDGPVGARERTPGAARCC